VTEDRIGLVQLYTGNGKGKTSAALGLALRAAGHGLAVCVVQFAKATNAVSGEVAAIECLPTVEIVRFGDSTTWGGMMPLRDLPAEAQAEAHVALDYAVEAVFSGRWDIVVLDEICVAVDLGLLDIEAVLHVIGDKPDAVELVLTGRGAPEALVEACDLVTEMVDIRHPSERGAGPRKGIEY